MAPTDVDSNEKRRPSLYGCTRRLQRSTRYIHEADSLIAGFGSECEERIFNKDDPNAGGDGKFHMPPVPPDLALAISDAVHNLRAALDYLIFELTLKDSGVIRERTQFPIISSRNPDLAVSDKIKLDALVDRCLRGISEPNRNFIKKLQPYRGTQWTQTLRDISNPDKHRHLIPIYRSPFLYIGEGVFGGKRLSTGVTIKANPGYTLLVELPEGHFGITTTLYTLQAHIADTLDFFNLIFNDVSA